MEPALPTQPRGVWAQLPARAPACALCLQTRASPFKDMILCFSEEDWSLLDPAQTGFYGEFIIGEDCGVSVPPGKAPQGPAPLRCPENSTEPLPRSPGCGPLLLHRESGSPNQSGGAGCASSPSPRGHLGLGLCQALDSTQAPSHALPLASTRAPPCPSAMSQAFLLA